MDSYVKAYVKTHVNIDAGGRVFCKGEQLEVHVIGGVKKVVLPISKLTYTFDDLKAAGAKCDVITLFSLAKAGAEGRWKDNIQERRENNIPQNVYIANARTIQRAIDKGESPPPLKWVGRKSDKITEVYDTVDEVVAAMAENRWRTEFSRGRYAKKGLPATKIYKA